MTLSTLRKINAIMITVSYLLMFFDAGGAVGNLLQQKFLVSTLDVVCAVWMYFLWQQFKEQAIRIATLGDDASIQETSCT